MSEIKKKYEAMRDAKDRANACIDRFLRACGWLHTSSTVGSVWMWTKTIDGETYYVDTNHAIRIEEHLNAEEIYDDMDF